MLENVDQFESNNFASDKYAFTLCARLYTCSKFLCRQRSNTKLDENILSENENICNPCFRQNKPEQMMLFLHADVSFYSL